MPRKTFHEELTDLRAKVLEMGRMALESVDDALKAVVDCDCEAADRVIERDAAIDALNLEIEDHSMTLIARQAPVAKDLRFCYSVMIIAFHLERMADLSVNMARGAKRVCPTEGVTELLDMIAEMGSHTTKLVVASLESFEKKDLALASSLGKMDEPIDHLFKDFFSEVTKHEGESVEWISSVLLACRYLERIADHAVDIGERITYLVTGESKDLD